MHDPAVYKDPDEFRPDRFIRDGKLNPDVLDPATIIFGSGRRSVYSPQVYSVLSLITLSF